MEEAVVDADIMHIATVEGKISRTEILLPFPAVERLAILVVIADDCCINRAIEGVVSKLMGVISQKITSLQVKVATQFGEVFMVDAAIDDGKVVVAVVDGISF